MKRVSRCRPRTARAELVFLVVLVATLASGCASRDKRFEGSGGVGPLMTGIFLGPRPGFHANESASLTTLEVIQIIPYIRIIPQLIHGFQAYGGRTLHEQEYRYRLLSPGASEHTLQLIEACREANLLSEAETAETLRHLALDCSYPSLVTLKTAHRWKAISESEYRKGIAELVKAFTGRDHNHNLNPRNRRLYLEAKRLRCVPEASLREQIRAELQIFSELDPCLAEEAYAFGLITLRDRDHILSMLLAELRLAIADERHDRGVLTGDSYRNTVRTLDKILEQSRKAARSIHVR